jgi:hypothetical protein
MKIALTKSNGNAVSTSIEPGRRVARIVQVANVGLQRGFNKGEAPTPHLGLAFETEDGVVVARTVRVSTTPGSFLFNIVEATLRLDPDNGDFDSNDLLDKFVAIDIEYDNRGQSRIVSFSALEEFDSVFKGKAALASFDADNITPEARDAFLKLHVELRRAISNRVRSNLDR